MILKFKFPDRFVPEEIEFQMYCTIKLYKGNYISKEEAMKMCNLDEKKINHLYNTIEKRYIKICGDGYAQDDYFDDLNNNCEIPVK